MKKKLLAYTFIILAYHASIAYLMAQGMINYDIVYTLIYYIAIVGYAIAIIKLAKTEESHKSISIVLSVCMLTYFILEALSIAPSVTEIFIPY